jgi:RHS repeat-associated protein
MNHLKSGTAFFAQGSYKSNKYSGKELQETGLYDYGWRQYMPDIGRWNGIDQLSEQYLSASPYAYVMNNPINMFDPDGRASEAWLADAPDWVRNSWTNTPAGSNSYWYNNGSGFTSYDGGSKGGNGGGTLAYGSTVGYGGGFVEGYIYVDIEEVVINGARGNKKTLFNSANNDFNSLLIYSKITGALGDWNQSQARSTLYDAIENTKVGRSVAEAEKFLFIDVPLSFAGGELLSAGWRASGIGQYLCRPIGRLTNGLIKICFTEGTLVAIENGTKKIEDIKEGDFVWSYNEETGKKELKKVVELFLNTSSSLVKISVNGTEITCTPEHPFYVNGNWIEAKHLTKGMLLTTVDGKISSVESIKFLNEKVKVYNFEVEGNHNYYVSKKGILVHNDCGLPQLFSRIEGNIIGGEFKYATGESIEFLANHNIKGSTLELTEMAFYPKGAVGNELANTFGNRQMIQSFKVLQNYAKENGFTQLRLQFQRAANSSSANPGHIFDQLIKL